ncbi:photosynthetic NDH subunit of lumenal location 4, chloroplastic isoform X3 [Telopea speciosissima]|uniref:photosynthetic NDH subunit of lumenal location 4, chloroplastic isoform X2 n=1 Tax=Telopea speciosissima TaxID=54955 RepID=UPI001CC48486|nr:photosynthetic NDH subunit of lumenal location 4, chloroplastic isoform X2 [Telopea speciosissima]XP_043722324.1 photosynthetic NDH subunit of lumenal location 4, chloroplastic isoform X3 [Telopea speciosissima]
MAVSSLTVAAVQKPHLLHTFKPNISPCTFRSNSSSSSNLRAELSLDLKGSSKRRFFDLGLGLLAASLLILSPLDANATRIEYYATVSEPSCELNFVRSGLGYCDVAVGTGDEAPYGELINIHYTARFADGIVFDSSYKRARPLTMRIGVGKVIAIYLPMQLLSMILILWQSTSEKPVGGTSSMISDTWEGNCNCL